MRDLLERQIDQALGRSPADLVVRNARILNMVTGELERGDIAVCGSTIVGTLDSYRGREEIDAQGRFAVPGFIDSHVHCESTLVTPGEFDRCVLPHGVTTAICDPHEIANVLGLVGLQYFLDSAREHRARFAGAALFLCARHQPRNLRRPAHRCRPDSASSPSQSDRPGRVHERARGPEQRSGVHGEAGRFPGTTYRRPRSPAFRSRLNAYLSCGIRNCHETTNLAEGREKLAKGMQVLIREGSVSKDLDALYPLINEFTSPFLGLCTDDRNPLDIHEGVIWISWCAGRLRWGRRWPRFIVRPAGRRPEASGSGIGG